MIRQKSMCIIKPVVKELPNVMRKQSLKEFKPDILQHKILTEEVQPKKEQSENKMKIKKEKKSCGLSKERSKTKINIKEQKISHEKHDAHKQKIQNNQKQSSSNIRPVCMKNDLKVLMTKNITKNRQNAVVQIEMLKKIEKVKQNRKMNDIKQRNKTSNITTKKNSPINDKSKEKEKISKAKKLKKQSTQKSEEPGQISPHKKHPSKQESEKLKYHFGLKNARFSLEYPLGVKRSQIEDALLIKPKKESKVSSNIPSAKSNFLQLFKNYKKSFQIDSIKLDKSMKKNQNNIQGYQSKNNSSVSSIFSSRKALFNAQEKQDLIIKDQHHNNNQIIDESSNTEFALVKKSQTFEKQQLFKSKIGNKIIDNLNIQAPLRPEIMFKKLKTEEVNDFASRKINLDEIQENDSFSVEIQEEDSEKIVPFELFRQQSPTKIDSKESSSIQHIKNKQNTTQVSQPFSEVDRHKLQKNFESSKYYVQPIPTFKTKLSGSSLQLQSPIINKDINDSLIGYQIELIQKNILVDEDEFEL